LGFFVDPNPAQAEGVQDGDEEHDGPEGDDEEPQEVGAVSPGAMRCAEMGWRW
jgi:hypothetical protein